MDIGNGHIYNDDCFNIFPKIADKSVDMVLCDLPYACLHKRNPNTSWDVMLPMQPLWEQYRRVIKDDGAIVLFGQGVFSARLIMAAEDIFRYSLVWDKMRCTGFLNANRMPLRQHEDILVFYKSLPTYNPQMTEGKPSHPQGNGAHKETNNCYGTYKPLKTYDRVARVEPTRPGMKFPTSIIRIRKEHERKVLHPTQKSVDLLRYLIRTYTNKGELVLDNTAGSMSTAIASIREERRFLMVEKDERYFKIGKKRIEEELKTPTLF